MKQLLTALFFLTAICTRGQPKNSTPPFAHVQGWFETGDDHSSPISRCYAIVLQPGYTIHVVHWFGLKKVTAYHRGSAIYVAKEFIDSLPPTSKGRKGTLDGISIEVAVDYYNQFLKGKNIPVVHWNNNPDTGFARQKEAASLQVPAKYAPTIFVPKQKH